MWDASWATVLHTEETDELQNDKCFLPIGYGKNKFPQHEPWDIAGTGKGWFKSTCSFRHTYVDTQPDLREWTIVVTERKLLSDPFTCLLSVVFLVTFRAPFTWARQTSRSQLPRYYNPIVFRTVGLNTNEQNYLANFMAFTGNYSVEACT
ncbi:hypothetical protein BJV74DRAFT_475380 [Russula compacta]|nr:hypothetical protein BJV74DRAFT_475380 [Russula compacta]